MELIAKASTGMPWRFRTFEVLSAETPRPMWLMLALAAKFL
jgi:hypothetical protein